jgi:hypothetical protein
MHDSRYGKDRTIWGDAFYATLTPKGRIGDKIECHVNDTVYTLLREEKIRARDVQTGYVSSTKQTSACLVGCRFPSPTYVVKCAPTISGSYTLSVTVNGFHVASSPHAVAVYPGSVDPDNTYLKQTNPKLWYGAVRQVMNLISECVVFVCVFACVCVCVDT